VAAEVAGSEVQVTVWPAKLVMVVIVSVAPVLALPMRFRRAALEDWWCAAASGHGSRASQPVIESVRLVVEGQVTRLRARAEVTKPTLATAPSRITVPSLTVSVPRRLAELSAASVQFPPPILVTPNKPLV